MDVLVIYMDNSNRIAANLPCSQYILQNIKDEDDLWLYAKTYIHTLYEQGVDKGNCLALLSASVSQYIKPEINYPDFTSLGSTSEEAFEAIISYKTTTPYKSCTTLYRRYENNTYCCKLCKLNAEKYRNAHADIEWAVIKYMLKSEDNLNRVCDYFTEAYFESVTDLTLGIPCNKSQVVPLPKELFLSASKETLRMIMFDGSGQINFLTDYSCPLDYVWADAFSTFPKKRKLSSMLRSNPKWEEVVKAEVYKAIDEAHELTEDEFEKLIDDIVHDRQSDSSFWDMSATPVFDTELGSNKDLEYPVKHDEEQPEPQTTSPAANNSEAPVETVTSSIEEGADCGDEARSDLIPADNEFSLSEADFRVYLDNNILLPRQAFDDRKELNLLDISTAAPEEFIQGTLRDKQLSIEVGFYKGKEPSFLMYSRHLKRILYCKASRVPSSLKNILTGNKVEKISYANYELISECRRQGIEIKNSYSLLSLFSMVAPSGGSLKYLGFIDVFSLDDRLSLTYTDDVINSLPYVKGLQLYRPIRKIIGDRLNELDKPMDIYEIRCLDEAYGSSYYFSHNFEDDGLSFVLTKPGHIVFKESFNRVKKKPGRYISYSVSENENASELYRFILFKLAEKGLFRKTNIQLLGSHKQVLNLYVGSDVEDYVLSVIEILIFEYGRNNKDKLQKINCMKYSN